MKLGGDGRLARHGREVLKLKLEDDGSDLLEKRRTKLRRRHEGRSVQATLSRCREAQRDSDGNVNRKSERVIRPKSGSRRGALKRGAIRVEPLVTGVARKKLKSVSRARVVGDVGTGERRTRTRPGVDEAASEVSEVIHSSIGPVPSADPKHCGPHMEWRDIPSRWKKVVAFFTVLGFWLRLSVVSVLNGLTAVAKASPSLLVI